MCAIEKAGACRRRSFVGWGLTALILTLSFPAVLLAHGKGHLIPTALTRWTFEPITIALLIGSGTVYALGLRVIWLRAGRGGGATILQASAFAIGLMSIAAALLSPIAWLSDVMFSAHMTQHEILMLISAPLLVVAHPLIVFLWALPSRWRQGTRAIVRRPGVARAWHALTGPLAAFTLHGAALWIWHVPSLYEAAVEHAGIHAIQHASFLLTAALFWWGMVHGRYGRAGYGVGVLYVFLTAVHSSVLGALMTIAPGPLYPGYVARGAPWSIDALQDQQLAGLLMWVPAGVIFILLGLALFAAWLGESGRRVALGRTEALANIHRPGSGIHGVRIPLAILAITGLLATSCESAAHRDAVALTGGDPQRGVEAIGRYGCGACHSVPGIRSAKGSVGPPLDHIANRSYLAGQLPNTPANMMQWIKHPQQVEHGTAMPEMGVTDDDARNIAAYLYTLR